MIIFDCDGVLVDSEILSNAIDAELMTEAGHAVTAEELISGYIGQPKAAIWAAIARERGEVWPEGLVERAEQRLLERIAAELQPVDGVADALAAIGRRKAVASSSSLPKLRLALQKTGLLANFDPDIFSASQVARGKPAPDVFLYAASQCGVAPGVASSSRTVSPASSRPGPQACRCSDSWGAVTPILDMPRSSLQPGQPR